LSDRFPNSAASDACDLIRLSQASDLPNDIDATLGGYVAGRDVTL